jgi:ATP-binding cassette subfamily B protein
MTKLMNNLARTRQSIKTIRAIAAYGRPYRRCLYLLAAASPLRSVPSLITPLIMQMMIDKAYPQRDLALLGWLCLAIVILDVIPLLIDGVTGYIDTYVNCLFSHKLTLRVHRGILHTPQSFLETHGPGMFLERASRDVAAVVRCVTQLLPKSVLIGFTFCAAVPLMMRVSIEISLIIVAVVPVNYLISACLTGRVIAMIQERRTISERLTTFFSETIRGSMLVELFSLGHLRRRRLSALLREYTSNSFAFWRKATLWTQLSGLISRVWGATLLCLGWYLVFSDRLQLGQAVALGMYISVLSRPFEQLEQLYTSLMTDSVSAQRVLELLHEGGGKDSPGNIVIQAAPPRHYELRGLSFAYGDNPPVLKDVHLSLRPGQTVVVVGPTGGGKSTLIRILCGLDDKYEGEFLVDGRERREIDPGSYLRHMSLVPQTTFFFSDSIRGNLPGGEWLAEADLQSCAASLGVRDVIAAAPRGYDTVLGCQGVQFSSGQYQKLAVLRAILKDASLLLLDEVTASMDIESERRLLRGIMSVRPAMSAMVMVTHHIAVTTEPWVDQIVVMSDGRIVEKGSYMELRKKEGLYHHWLRLTEEPAERRLAEAHVCFVDRADAGPHAHSDGMA